MSCSLFPPGCVWIDWAYPSSETAERFGYPNGCYVIMQQVNHVKDAIQSAHASPISAVREMLKFDVLSPIMLDGWRGDMVEQYRKMAAA